MKRFFIFPTLLASVALLGACGSLFSPSVPPSGKEASSSTRETVETVPPEEVTYQGTMEAIGASSVPSATHRLALGDGLYLYLVSTIVDLNEYLGQDVRVKGVVRSTVEGDADLMRVSYVETVLSEPSSSSSESDSSISSLESSSSTRSSSASPSYSSRVSSVARSSNSSVASVMSSSSQGSSLSSVAVLSDQAKEMAKIKTDAGLWTQKYCTAHIGFCIPVYKNWWYKSFGTTASHLWHVELNTQEIETMGDGVISVDFESGALPSGASDGTVQEIGVNVIGYRAWTNGRHFQIVAPKELRSVVQYITENLATYEAPAA